MSKLAASIFTFLERRKRDKGEFHGDTVGPLRDQKPPGQMPLFENGSVYTKCVFEGPLHKNRKKHHLFTYEAQQRALRDVLGVFG